VLIQALNRERTAFWMTERAQVHWQAARILRQDGLQLFGTETSPDQFALGAEFTNGYGPDKPFAQADTFTPQERALRCERTAA
jgi:hypothetical protein